ncbi:HK97 gp10 family phage protein [Paenibacillus periandrae]|uniref:HK97 gp10 family phage protein n=1 Tax=Paenibacillus periandrae TaxID=1761741 RepID=UPI001F0953D3|nr:HK97 gp10 family phage protein [Paenibacillus periandrae]
MSSMGSFDFEDWKKLQKDLQRLQGKLPQFYEECIKELVGRLLAKTKARTPVGVYEDKWVEFTTKTGKEVRFFARAHGKQGGTLRRGWTVGQVERTAGGYQVEIINPVPYAMYVEYGHRARNAKNGMGWVEGRFMLTKSIEELEREMPAFLDRKMKQFLEQNLGW